jgi:pimeloyl-ACP methyl ester carboxylesterase
MQKYSNNVIGSIILCILFVQALPSAVNPREPIKINLEIVGEGLPVIMLHDFGSDSNQMKGCMEPLFKKRPGWKRIYIDLPGMGKTEAKNWANNTDRINEIVSSLIDTRFMNSKIVLVGHSYGAYLARAIAQEKGDIVEGVLMIAPLTVPETEKRKLPKYQILEKDSDLIAKLNPEDAKLFQAQVVIQNEKTWQRFKDDILPGIKAANQEYLMNLRGRGFAFSYDLNRIRMFFQRPSLIITGRQDHIVGYFDALELLDFFPKADFVILDSAGHNLQFEQEAAFNFLVSRWLDKIEKNLKTKYFLNVPAVEGIIDINKAEK